MQPIHVPDDLFRRLAAGPVEVADVRFLRRAQYSKNLQLIAHAVSALPGGARWTRAVDVLDEVRRRDPEAAEHLLTTPTVGSWAARCALRAEGRFADEPDTVAVGYLHALAAAGAARCGLDADLVVTARAGLAVLPTLGAARVRVPDHAEVRVRIRAGQVTVHTDDDLVQVPADPQRATADWLPLRELVAEAGGRVLRALVDDLDPHRDSYRKQLAGRLPDAEAARWAQLFAGAWELLASHAPRWAHELPAGLRTLVPLSPADAGPGLSATSGTAFGALALTLPQQPAHLAVTLVHEYQHSKLSGLLDLVPMYEVDSGARYFAPWRPDPRPLGGLLQGAYAFLAVSDLWSRLGDADCGTTGPQRHFAELRVQVDEVLTTLAAAPQLNEAGRAFVATMRQTLDPLLAVPLPAGTEAAARASLEEIRAGWRQRAGVTASATASA